MDGVESVEPSSTSISSQPLYVCASTDSIAAGRYFPALYAGTMTDTVGGSISPYQTVRISFSLSANMESIFFMYLS